MVQFQFNGVAGYLQVRGFGLLQAGGDYDMSGRVILNCCGETGADQTAIGLEEI